MRRRDVAGRGRLVAAQQRQIDELDERLSRNDGSIRPRGALRAGAAAIDFRIDAARFDVARAVLVDLGHAEQPAIFVIADAHDVRRLDRQ